MMIRDWSEIPKQSHLVAGDCRLWLAWLDDENPDEFLGFLSEDERLRVGRLRSPRSVNRFTVSRGILRILLGRILAQQPEHLVFSYGPYGKPELARELREGLSFNVSHSGSLAVFAVANGFQVGVDIEEVRPLTDIEDTASIFLSPGELADFKVLPKTEKLDRFFMLWTCKEAILKALGSGFYGPVKDILTVFHRPDQCTVSIPRSEKNRLTLIEPAEGFKGALACV